MPRKVLIAVVWVACALAVGCGGGSEEDAAREAPGGPEEVIVHEMPGDAPHDLGGYWTRITDVECAGSADQEKIGWLSLNLDDLSGAESLLITQDGETLTFQAGDHYSHYVLDADVIIGDTEICWIEDSDVPYPYNQGCHTRGGVVLEGGSVIEITELYELGRWSGGEGPVLACVHEWGRDGEA